MFTSICIEYIFTTRSSFIVYYTIVICMNVPVFHSDSDFGKEGSRGLWSSMIQLFVTNDCDVDGPLCTGMI